MRVRPIRDLWTKARTGRPAADYTGPVAGLNGTGTGRRGLPASPVPRGRNAREGVLPATTGWYWLLVIAGLAGTMTLLGGLSRFLGWPAGAREPFVLGLVAALPLVILANVPFAGLLLVGLLAARIGWLALFAPERLAEVAVPSFPGIAAGTAGRVLLDLWLGTYEGLPEPLLAPGTLLVAALHVALVLRAARRPATALTPVVAGGLAFVLAWFYGSLPRPDGWTMSYLILAFAFTGLARVAAPAGPRAWSHGVPDRRWWRGWHRRWFAMSNPWPYPAATAAPAPDPALLAELARRRVPLRLFVPAAGQALALMLVAALLAGTLPARDEPYDWVPVTSAANRLLPFTIADRAGGWGAVPGGSAGAVAPRQYLGGPFFPDSTPLLAVTVEGDRLPQALYLRGATRIYYDGRSWAALVTEPFNDAAGAAFQMAMAQSLDGTRTEFDEARPILQRIEPRIPLRNFLYAVLEPRQVNGQPPDRDGYRLPAKGEGPVPTLTADLTLRIEGQWDPAAYTVESLTREFDPGAIREAARRAMRGNPEALAFVPSRYLQLPADLPQRVRDLAWELTADKENPYDKAKAIENYLRQFRYDLNMPYTPPGRDFVDYFLFDLQRGYCVAYASAAVVMLRSIGLPARWVEGFVVPIGGRPGTYTVTHAQAHAWVEVLIPGYGWVPLEPTPAYPDRPLAPAPPPDSTAPAGSTGQDPAELPPRDRPRPADRTPDAPASAGEPSTGGVQGMAHPSPLATGVAVAAVLALAAGLVAAWRRRTRPLPPPDPYLAARHLFARTERELARLGFGRAPDMTPREYAAWLARRLPDLAPEWLRLAELYERARYGRPAGVAPAAAPGAAPGASPGAAPGAAPGASPGAAPGAAPGTASGAVTDAPLGPGPSPDPAEIERLRAEIVAGLTRVLGWRYRWVRRAPDPGALLVALAARVAAWTPRPRSTRMGGEGRTVGFES